MLSSFRNLMFNLLLLVTLVFGTGHSMATEYTACSADFWREMTLDQLDELYLDWEAIFESVFCGEKEDSVPHIAARYTQDPMVIEMLLINDADFEATNLDGESVLDYAAENDDPAIVEKVEELLEVIISSPFPRAMPEANEQGQKEERRGPYIGFDMVGAIRPLKVDTSLAAVTNPTKCDVLLYSDPTMAPRNAPECTDGNMRDLSSQGFAPGTSLSTGAVRVGYAFNNFMRVEFEYSGRGHPNASGPPTESATNPAVASKQAEWSEVFPPHETLSYYNARQFFSNFYVDIPNRSRWTPYGGVGIGFSPTSLSYGRRLLRKTIPQGYQDVEPPLTIADRPAQAAGTISLMEHTGSANLLGVQTLFGIDYDLKKGLLVGLNARWAHFQKMEEDVKWSLIRSHTPVRADGITPFTGKLTFENLGYLELSLGMRYQF